jgi:hypothetical protein
MKHKTYNNHIADAYWEVYGKYLSKEAGKVMANIPHPFGSFEKATYILKRDNRNGEVAYFYQFTTTCHNTEECIEILKEKFKERVRQESYCVILKIQNGIQEEILRQKIHT